MATQYTQMLDTQNPRKVHDMCIRKELHYSNIRSTERIIHIKCYLHIRRHSKNSARLHIFKAVAIRTAGHINKPKAISTAVF